MTATKPRVYCASPYARAKMWRPEAGLTGPSVTIVSTWHNDDIDESSIAGSEIADYWEKDFAQIRQADTVLAYAEAKDRPNGTLIEIGYALAHQMEVHLVGNFAWGTWRHYPLVFVHSTIREAITAILGVPVPSGVSEGDPL